MLNFQSACEKWVKDSWSGLELRLVERHIRRKREAKNRDCDLCQERDC